MKAILSIVLALFFSSFTAQLFAECTEEEKVKMVTSGIAFDKVSSLCGASNSEVKQTSRKELLDNIKKAKRERYERLRIEEPNGAGFGFGSSPFSLTTSLFFDHNIGLTKQIHIQFDSANRERATSDSTSVTTNVKRTMTFATYRNFSPSYKGAYFGFGLGYVQSQLNFTAEEVTEYSSSKVIVPKTDYTATGNGFAAVVEVGWQGDDGYYFNIGFQPASYINYSDDFDKKKIPDLKNYRTAMVEDWEASKKLGNAINLGFGWFF